MYSFQANGGLNICTKVSSDIAKKPPIARTGLVAVYVDTISCAPDARLQAAGPQVRSAAGSARARCSGEDAPSRPQLHIVTISRRHGRNATRQTAW